MFRAGLIATLLAAGCHQSAPALPLVFEAAPEAEATIAILNEVCLKNLGNTRAVRAIARASNWRRMPLTVLSGWEGLGIRSKYKDIWAVPSSEGGVIYVAIGSLGGSTGPWLCRIAWNGASNPDAFDKVAALEFEGRPIGQPEMIQANVPWDGNENALFQVSASIRWAVINYSRPASTSPGKVRVDVTTQARP